MFKKILIPIDVDAKATWGKAVEAAVTLARASGAELHALSVLPDFGLSIVGSYFPEGYEDKVRSDMTEKLVAMAKEHFPEDAPATPHVVQGKIYEQIINAADKLDCDAIVMASHRPELSDYLLGPNAARVVRHARQSVFVVRD